MKVTILTVDEAGRISLPRALRKLYDLRVGSELEVSGDGDHLTLRPRRRLPTLTRNGSWWVHGVATDEVALEEAVARHRDERLDDLSR